MNYSNDCRSKWRFGSNWLAVIFALLSVVTFSCDDESESAKELLTPSDLLYASVTEVYEGKVMESAKPVVFSATIAKFEIAAGTAEEGGVYIDGEFQIVDTTGVIKLNADNLLIAGTYSLDIKVTDVVGETIFPKAFELIVLPSAIEALQYTPLTQVLVRGVEGQKTTLPVFKGTKPVTFTLSEDSDFVIDAATGEISLALDSQIDAGEYRLSVEATNVTGEQTFEEVVRMDVQTLPYNLVYSTKAYLGVQQTQAKQSVEPAIKGTGPIAYSLKNSFDAFIIDRTTGMVSLAEKHTLAIDTYNLTVVATNEHGSVEFVDALSFEIIAIQAITATDLTYTSSSYTLNQAFAFATDIPTVSGSTPTYSLLDNYGEFAIDAVTGVVSLAEGNSLAIGDYPLTVKAINLAGESTFTDIITITIKIAVVDQLFKDGWDNVSPSTGEKGLGNMLTISTVGDPFQASNNKWSLGWGNWSVHDQAGATMRGAVMIPGKKENDDWLMTPSVDLTNHINTKVNFAGYSKYGVDASTLKLLVSENYNGDVETATWTELAFDKLPTSSPSKDREVDLSQFDGKIVTIALRHSSLLSGDLTLTNFTRSHFILNFEVNAIRK